MFPPSFSYHFSWCITVNNAKHHLRSYTGGTFYGMSNIIPERYSTFHDFITICIIECEFEYTWEEIVPYYNLHFFFILLASFQWLYLPVLINLTLYICLSYFNSSFLFKICTIFKYVFILAFSNIDESR